MASPTSSTTSASSDEAICFMYIPMASPGNMEESMTLVASLASPGCMEESMMHIASSEQDDVDVFSGKVHPKRQKKRGQNPRPDKGLYTSLPMAKRPRKMNVDESDLQLPKDVDHRDDKTKASLASEIIKVEDERDALKKEREPLLMNVEQLTRELELFKRMYASQLQQRGQGTLGLYSSMSCIGEVGGLL